MQPFEWLIPELSNAQWFAHGLIFVINIGLLFLSKPILSLIESTDESDTKLRIFRSLNILVLVLHVFDLAFLRVSAYYENYFINVGLSLMAVYASLFAYSFCGLLAKKRFGSEKIVDEKKVYLNTYSTRLVELILLVVIILTLVYALIKIWGADSMLETTGIFGILVAFLAFTSNIWAPDIISGLIILNTKMLEDGDVVVVDGFPDEYIISKVTLIYVILYDVRNNHRTLIRNSQFTERKIDNLSRVASTDGVRKSLRYNIGYPLLPGESAEQRLDKLTSFTNRVDRMFSLAQESCKDQKNIKINANRDFEWSLTRTADYALEYTLWIYLERIPNTKVTSTIRKHLVSTLYQVNEAVYAAAIAEAIDLSTPNLATVEIQAPSAPAIPAM